MSQSAVSAAAPVQPAARKRGFGLRFSLRALLLLMLLVAVYFGGRASMNWRNPFAPRLDGDWEAKLPAGWVQPTTIQILGDGQYLLSSRASIFNGKYQWQNGKLVVVEPADDRMLGLVWNWDGQQLTLISEPKNTPTGSSYTGTVLTRPAARPAAP
jgi:hypothetical protein